MRTHRKVLRTLCRGLAVAAFAAVPALANAQSAIYSFGLQISHPYSTPYQPSDTFATLSVMSDDLVQYTFDLRVSANFSTLFGTDAAAIRGLAFNTSSAAEPLPGSVHVVGGGWGVSNVWWSPNDVQLGGGVVFDFSEGWYGGDSGSARLTSGERVMWVSSFGSPTSFLAPPVALKVFGIGGDDSNFAWYVPTVVTPVPEPSAYATLLAGLGILGFAWRRKSKGGTTAKA